MSVCRNSVNSFIGLPPVLEEDHFSQAFHQTLGVPSPPSSPPYFPPNYLNLTLNPLKPIKVLDPLTTSPAVSAGDLAGDSRNSGHIDLMSCTESLGFESSEEMMSSLDDLGSFESCNSRRNNGGLSSSSSSSFFLRRREKRVSSLLEEKNFPPPLTSLSENGRRNFTLKSMRNNGRLQIVGVMTEHPEILYASRDNGRLRLHLVKDVNHHHHHHDHHDNHDEKEKNTEEREKEEEREKTEEENQEDDVAEDDDDDEEEEEEEREWKNPTVGRLRRWCYYHRPMHVWGPQQQQNTRYVTTI